MFVSECPSVFKRFAFFVQFLFFISGLSFAFGTAEKIQTLVEHGTVNSMEKAFGRYSHLSRTALGKDGDSLIMEAIEHDRDINFIKFLEKADVKFKSKNRNGQSALHYICKYSDDNNKVFSYVLDRWGTKYSVSKALLAKDKYGFSAYEYALDNLGNDKIHELEGILEPKIASSIKEKHEPGSTQNQDAAVEKSPKDIKAMEKLVAAEKKAEAKREAKEKKAFAAAEKKAEEKRLADEKKALAAKEKAEEKRLEKENKKAAAAEEKAEEKMLSEKTKTSIAEKKAEAKRLAEEKKISAAEKKAEAKRLADEKKAVLAEKKAEEKRLADEKKALAEEKRLIAERKAEEKRLAEEREAALAAKEKAEKERLAEEKTETKRPLPSKEEKSGVENTIAKVREIPKAENTDEKSVLPSNEKNASNLSQKSDTVQTFPSSSEKSFSPSPKSLPEKTQPQIEKKDSGEVKAVKEQSEAISSVATPQKEPPSSPETSSLSERFDSIENPSADIEKRQKELSSLYGNGETFSEEERDFLFDYAPKTYKDDYAEKSSEDMHLTKIKNPNSRDFNGRSLLMKAVKNGNDWEIRSLLESGADVNVKDNDGWSALMYAVRYQNNLEVVRLLLRNGADLTALNKYGSSPLDLAATYSSNPEILRSILKEFKGGQGEIFRAFVFSITSDVGNHASQIAKLQVFVDRGIQLNRFYEGKTPLMYAAGYSSSTDVIEFLLDNGAAVSIRDSSGKKAFDYAKANVKLERDETFWRLNGN
ncbi:MAG: ankyrin repeat domain-containing protein [Treponema sp.]